LVRPTAANTTTLVTVAKDGTQSNGFNSHLDMSADGRYVVFYSLASNLAAGDTNGAGDVFLVDTQTGDVTRLPAAGDEGKWIYGTLAPTISPDGHFVAYTSDASDIVPGVGNGQLQVYRYEIATGTTILLSTATGGGPGDHPSVTPSLSEDGADAVFTSEADDLIAGDTIGKGDIFLRVPTTGHTLLDAADALRIAGGLAAATPADLSRFGVASGASVTLQTAVRMARKATGVDSTP
jgi:Tol biopolymer transport system component